MDISVEDITKIIDEVGEAAKCRKKVLDTEYKRSIGDGFEIPLNWYRSRKNADIKDALTLEGIKRGFSVRAEKTMGALPEYCDNKDQKEFNRFDLSWERVRNSRSFSLAVEIEMDINLNSVLKDFKKLVKNNSECLKVMICQARKESEIEDYKNSIEKEVSSKPQDSSTYILSVWSWPKSSFVHYIY